MTKKTNPIDRYINGLRNKAKKEYARAYLAWVMSGEQGPEPDDPDGLSYMACQGVRLTIHKLVLETPVMVRVPFVNVVREFTPVGAGAYPYDCIHKDKFPDAVVYEDETGAWVAIDQLEDTGLGYYCISSRG